MALSLTLVGCGESSAQSGAQSAQSEQSSQSEVDSSQSAAVDGAMQNAPKVDRDPQGTLPEFEIPSDGEAPTMIPVDADPPSVITVKTLIAGDGKVVGPDDFVTVKYIGFLWDGKEFDSSYSREKPATFSLNEVIEGWKWGLTNTKVGDTVALIVPPKYGYGAAGTGSIPGNSTLVFVVTVVDSVSVNTAVLAEATASDAELPEGLTVVGELGTEPTFKFASGSAAPTQTQAIVVAKGTGRVITDDDTVAYHLVGATWGAKGNTSSWNEGVRSTAALGTVLAGQNIGSRLVLIEPANDEQGSAPQVVAIDILGAVGSNGN